MLFCFCVSFFCRLLKPNTWWDPEKRFCVLCDCNPVGSVTPQCGLTGRCACKSGFVGRHCNLSRQVHRQEEQSRRAHRVLGLPQRWGSGSSSGCPRGAYRPPAPVIQRHCMAPASACCVPCAATDLPRCHFYQIMVAWCAKLQMYKLDNSCLKRCLLKIAVCVLLKVCSSS